MKKLALVAALMAAFSASAADLTVTNGRDKVAGKDMLKIAVGDTVAGLRVEAYEQSVRNSYHAVGAAVGKRFDIGTSGVAVTPMVGVSYSDPISGKSGWNSTVGGQVSYDLNKNAAIVGEFVHRNNLHNGSTWSGNQATAGLKVSF
jgi:hypothetical protein